MQKTVATQNARTKMNVYDLTKMSLLTAILCVSAWISFPLPFTPTMVTAQTLVVNVIGLLLSPIQTLFVMITYILLGIVGLPVFAGFTSGFSKLLSPSGGYIIAFLVAAVAMSFVKQIIVKRFKIYSKYKFIVYFLITIIVGMTIIYMIGNSFMAYQLNVTFYAALAMGVIPFIFGDVVKCIGGVIVAIALEKSLSIIHN